MAQQIRNITRIPSGQNTSSRLWRPLRTKHPSAGEGGAWLTLDQASIGYYIGSPVIVRQSSKLKATWLTLRVLWRHLVKTFEACERRSIDYCTRNPYQRCHHLNRHRLSQTRSWLQSQVSRSRPLLWHPDYSKSLLPHVLV